MGTRIDARSYGSFTHVYLKVKVRNKGHRAALKCTGTSKVLIPSKADSWLYPTSNSYDIAWGNKSDRTDVSQEKMEINPNKEEELHIAFFDTRFQNSSANFHHPRYAEFSTVAHLNVNDLMEEDSFSEQDYLIITTVTWHGGSTRNYFVIHIDHDKDKQSIRKASISDRLRIRFNRQLPSQ